MPQKNSGFENMDLIGVLTPLPRSFNVLLAHLWAGQTLLATSPCRNCCNCGKNCKKDTRHCSLGSEDFLAFWDYWERKICVHLYCYIMFTVIIIIIIIILIQSSRAKTNPITICNKKRVHLESLKINMRSMPMITSNNQHYS